MCDEREQLMGYVYDDGSAEERARIEDHLESCATCRDEIRGLRRTREDLLAWDVPAHAPIWRPVRVAAESPWWRRSPVGLLASAAAVVLLAGMGGAAATRVMLPGPAPAPAGVTAQELNDVQRQMVALLRTELDQMQRAVSAAAVRPAAGPAVDTGLEHRVMARLDESNRESLDRITELWNNWTRVRKLSDTRTDKLQVELDSMRQALERLGGGR